MKVNIISKQEFLDMCYNSTEEFLARIAAPEVFIVKEFVDKNTVSGLRNDSFEWGTATEASWHPLHDDCPDYHRLHDNYAKAHVKQKFHGFYRHGWFESNQDLIDKFADIYQLKNYLGGFDKDSSIRNIPSQGVVARLNVHHYPKGGGYQAEHIDPASVYAKIQTIIVASQIGTDYTTGGVFARETLGGEKHYIDSFTSIGDMIVMSPDIPHGVEAIDDDTEYSSQTNDGRWIILPLFLFSDYPHEDNIKPKQVG